MKVLHLLFSGLGGTADVVFSILEADKEKKTNQSILFSGPKIYKNYKDKVKKLNIKYSFIKTKKYLPFFSYFKILNKLFFFKPKIIVIHNYQIMPCLIYKFFTKSTKIIYVSHTPISNYTYRDTIIRSLFSFIDKFIVLNKEHFLLFKKYFKKRLNKIALITNGINTKKFLIERKIKKKYFKIGMACRVNKQKKYDLIVDALNSTNLKNLNIKFSLAGDGEDLKNFQKKIKKLNINNRVKIEGFLNENLLKKWYSTLDLYIQASKGESMSMSLLQAMSMKIPTIGSNVTGIKDVFKKNKGVSLLFENNEKDLAQKIRYFYFLKTDKKLKIVNKQYNYVVKNHSNIKMFNNYKKIFNQLVKV